MANIQIRNLEKQMIEPRNMGEHSSNKTENVHDTLSESHFQEIERLRSQVLTLKQYIDNSEADHSSNLREVHTHTVSKVTSITDVSKEEASKDAEEKEVVHLRGVLDDLNNKWAKLESDNKVFLSERKILIETHAARISEMEDEMEKMLQEVEDDAEHDMEKLKNQHKTELKKQTDNIEKLTTERDNLNRMLEQERTKILELEMRLNELRMKYNIEIKKVSIAQSAIAFTQHDPNYATGTNQNERISSTLKKSEGSHTSETIMD